MLLLGVMAVVCMMFGTMGLKADVTVGGELVCRTNPTYDCCVTNSNIRGQQPVKTFGTAPNPSTLSLTDYDVFTYYFIPDSDGSSTGLGVIDGQIFIKKIPTNPSCGVCDTKYFYAFDTSYQFTAFSAWQSALSSRGITVTQ